MRNLKQILSVFTVIVVFGLQTEFCHGQVPSAPVSGMTKPFHQASFGAILEDGFRDWENGYLIAYGSNHTLETTPSKPGLILYDHDGRVARQPIVWVDGASIVTVRHAAANQSGNLVVAGGAVDSKGALASFIGQIGSDDRLHSIIRTTPFAPAYVCPIDDGTVWTYGTDRDDHHNVVQDSIRLRHYSFEKGQLQALLNVTTLPDYAATHNQWRFDRGNAYDVSLRCNSRSLVLYNAPSGDLIELDLKTTAMTVTKVPLFPAQCPTFCITGFTLTDSGEMFASFLDNRKRGTPLSGLFRLTHTKPGTAEWVAVSGTLGIYLKDSPIHKLWGSDGDNVVYSQQRDGRLYWSKPSSE